MKIWTFNYLWTRYCKEWWGPLLPRGRDTDPVEQHRVKLPAHRWEPQLLRGQARGGDPGQCAAAVLYLWHQDQLLWRPGRVCQHDDGRLVPLPWPEAGRAGIQAYPGTRYRYPGVIRKKRWVIIINMLLLMFSVGWLIILCRTLPKWQESYTFLPLLYHLL